VVSRPSAVGGQRHPWTTGHGRISDTKLSLDCYHGNHGTHLTNRLSGTLVTGSRGESHIKWSNGDVWYERRENFRAITQPVATVGALPFNVIGAATPTFMTSTWESQHGNYFHRHQNGRWYEYDSRGQERFRYREAERTRVAVTLVDDRRRVSVQLRKNECLYNQGSSDDWRKLSRGRFASRTPDVHGSRAGYQHRQHLNETPATREAVQVNVGIERFFQGLFGGRD